MIICEYGCGQPGSYQFKNGKWCCSKQFQSCSEIKRKNSDGNKKIWKDPESVFNSKEYRTKISRAATGKPSWNKNKTKNIDTRILKQSNSLKKTWNDKTSYLNSETYKKKLKDSRLKSGFGKKFAISNRFTIKQIKKKYPFFSQVEEMRYDPDKPGEKVIQVRCKYNECPNSKERGGWFTPTPTQRFERIRNLENPKGSEGSYFYCSEECKNICPLYNLKSDPYKTKDQLYTNEEYETFRQEVLKRQREEYGYNFCEYCDSEENLHVHHEKPQKTNILLVLDPDNGVVLCKDCHYIIGHQDECSTGNLANKICI